MPHANESLAPEMDDAFLVQTQLRRDPNMLNALPMQAHKGVIYWLINNHGS